MSRIDIDVFGRIGNHVDCVVLRLDVRGIGVVEGIGHRIGVQRSGRGVL
jgi:hypothetical protein